MRQQVVVIFVLICVAFASKRCTIVIDRNDEYLECEDVTSLKSIVNEWQTDLEYLRIRNGPEYQLEISGITRSTFPSSLKYLDLSQAGQILIRDSGFKGIKSLRSLNLSKTGIEAISKPLLPRKLKKLDLSFNSLPNFVAQDLRHLDRLTDLILTSTGINHIEGQLAASNLEYLDVSLNEFKRIKDVGFVAGLKHLRVSDNLIAEVTKDDFLGFPKLKQLDLSFNVINKIENKSFSELRKLKEINLRGNALTEISRDLFSNGTYEKLEKLLLGQNKINMLESDSFELLHDLEVLDLSGNSLRKVDKTTFSGLDSLKRLNISDNDISSIESLTFATLPSLESIDLSGNQLQILDGNIFGSPGRKLEEIFLARNGLTELNPELFEPIGNVRLIDVSWNKLRNIDEDVFLPLRKVTKLYLSHNSIRDIPDRIYEIFGRLSELRIDFNHLSFLRLSNNTSVRRLQKISLQGNPWQCKCLDEIVNFMANEHVNYVDGLSSNGETSICIQTSNPHCLTDLQKINEELIKSVFEVRTMKPTVE